MINISDPASQDMQPWETVDWRRELFSWARVPRGVLSCQRWGKNKIRDDDYVDDGDDDDDDELRHFARIIFDGNPGWQECKKVLKRECLVGQDQQCRSSNVEIEIDELI